MKTSTAQAFLTTVFILCLGGLASAASYDPSGGTDPANYVLTENSQAVGNGTFGGTFNAQNFDLTVISLTGNMIFGGVISGNATSPLPTLTVGAGNHTVVLNAANTFSGDVRLASGTLQLGNAEALGSSAGKLHAIAGPATLDLNGQSIASENALIEAAATFLNSSSTAAGWGGTIAISGANLTFNAAAGNIAVAGAISGGGVIKTGAGVLTVSGDNSGLSAAWNLQQGTLKLGSATAVGAAVLAANSGVAVDLNGQAVGNKTYDASADSTILNSSATAASWGGSVVLGSHTLTVNATAGDITASGAIAGSGNIIKEGGNTLTLTSASSTFTGNLTVAGGTVAFDGNSNFLIGASGISNAIDGTGSAVFDGTFYFNLLGAGTGLGNTWDIVDVVALTESWQSNFSVFGFTHGGGGVWTRNNSGTLYQFSQTTGQLSVIPEPSTLALAAVAGCLLLQVVRRRSSACA